MLLITLLIGYRLITPQMIETGGDAVLKWWLARRANESSLVVMGDGHHGARFGINLVTWMVQKAFGTHPLVYYVPAYLMSVLEVVFLYLVCRLAAGIWPAAIAVVCLILHPLMIRNGAQLLPGVFSGAYIMGALFFLAMCFGARVEKIALYRTLAALLFFAAYLSKVPNLFFLPALVLGVWSIRRDYRDVLWFLGLLLFLAALEWSFYAVVKGHFYGRLATVQQHYNVINKFMAKQLPEEYLSLNWLDLLRYRYAPRFMGGETLAFFFYAALGCAVYLLARAPGLASVKALLGYALLSYAFINGIAVKSLDPLIPIQNFLPRYLAVLVPLSAATIILATADFGALVCSSLASARQRRFPVIGQNIAVISVGLAVALLFHKSNQDSYVFDRQSHPFRAIDRYQDIIGEGIRDCVLFVALDHNSEFALRMAFLYNYKNLVRAEQEVTDPHAAGIAKECLDRYPDWPAYLATLDKVTEVDVILASRDDGLGRRDLTIERKRVPVSYLTRRLRTNSSR